MDGLARELEIDRHGDEAGPHDAEIGREIFGAIGRQDRDPLAAREAAGEQGAGDAVRHRVERAIAELARGLLAAEIDERDLVEIAVAVDQVAEVLELEHLQMIAATCSVCSLSPCIRKSGFPDFASSLAEVG